MDNYHWNLVDGTRCEISLTDKLDSSIEKYKGGQMIQNATMRPYEVISSIPHIVKYCLDQNVDLRERSFFRGLPREKPDMTSGDTKQLIRQLKTPLMADLGIIRERDNDLIIKSYSSNKGGGAGMVIFESQDVPNLAEGLIRMLDYDEKTRDSQEKAMRIIQQCHGIIDRGFFK